MAEWLSRTELLLGMEATERLSAVRVAVFGVGGVGGYVVEALARSGIGALDLIDSDTVSLSNLNRQIYALRSTIGKYKVDIAAERIIDINPDCKVTAHRVFYLPENADEFDFTKYDYIVDAVDTVSAKLEIITRAKECGTAVISAMGAGNKLNAAAFEVADIYGTSVCPLARVMRRELKKRGIKSLKVVYSREEPITPQSAEGSSGGANFDALGAANELRNGVKSSSEAARESMETCAANAPHDCGVKSASTSSRRAIPGSVAFVPGAAGLIIAGEVVKDLINADGSEI